ncbi:MAG: hypothetical protein ACE5GE_01265 [Phycisphaerae bacterium]
MSRKLNRSIGLFLLPAGIMVGCSAPTSRLNAPPQGVADHPNQMQPFFTYMTDNAAMSDMDIADVHFVPHTTELNSLGANRLNRMAHFMESYGGTVRYTTHDQDEQLVNQRIAHVKEYLAAAGADMDRVDVQVAMAGSNRTSAEDAIAAEEKGWASDFNVSDQGLEGSR